MTSFFFFFFACVLFQIAAQRERRADPAFRESEVSLLQQDPADDLFLFIEEGLFSVSVDN
jgi:hypothetical protein